MMVITRRNFIWAGLTATGALALGLTAPAALRFARQYRRAGILGATSADIALIEIAPDGSVTVFSTLTEMGQSVWLTLTQIVGEELDVELSAVSVRMAPSWRAYGTPVEFYTGGSSSTQRLYKHMRQVGAAARAMLITAASKQWQVPLSECSTDSGTVRHERSGRHSSYGELAQAAAQLPPPENPVLKSRSAWRLVGKPQHNPQARQIVTGATRYGIDFTLPDMVVAAVAQSPLEGATLVGFDRTKVMAHPGVLRIVELPDTLAVVAATFWQAQRALQAANIQWQQADVSTDALRTQLRAAVDDNTATDTDAGQRKVSAFYEAPFVAHMQLEPLNATASITRVGPGALSAELWVPTQAQDSMRVQVARALGTWSEAVTIHTPQVGGGFGRRLRVDYGVTAARIARELDTPVKVIWSREEDCVQGRFRPMCAARLTATVGPMGELLDWQAAAASTGEQSRTWGLEPLPYKSTTQRVAHRGVATPVRTGPWRSVDASQNVFFRESFLDECAHTTGANPLHYRLALLADNARARRVLETLAQVAAWPATPDGKRHLGCAYNDGFGSLSALAVEIQAESPETWKITKVWVVVDCGIAINPNSIRAQLEGGVLFGLSAALFEAATYRDGALEQRNYDRYRLLRIGESPLIETHILESDGVEIGGMGEVAVPLIAPAVANALFVATGKRIRSLPMRDATTSAAP